MIRRSVAVIPIAVILSSGLATPAAPQPTRTGRLAARVNGIGISQDRLESSFQAHLNRRGMNQGVFRQPDEYKAVRHQVLEILIGQELLWQEAEAKKLIAPAEEVERALARVRERFSSEEAFLRQIERGGFTKATYAEDLKRQLSVRRLVHEEIAKGVTVTDQELDDIYRANLDKMRRPEQVRVRHVLIKLEPGTDQAADKAARTKIDGILAEARAGADFAELARRHSQGPGGPKGGDLGFVARRQLVKPFADAAFALKPGEVSEVVRTRFGYHIIRPEERRGGDLMPKEEVADRIRQHLRSAKIQESVDDWVARLRAAATIEILEPM